MAKRGKASSAGEASVPPALSASERQTVDASVASLSGLNLDQLRLQWRNQLGGIAPAHLGDVESDRFVARGGEPSGIAGANPARVGVMPISSNGFGPGVALLFLLGAPFLTAFSPKKRCPFQFVPVIALATSERLR